MGQTAGPWLFCQNGQKQWLRVGFFDTKIGYLVVKNLHFTKIRVYY